MIVCVPRWNNFGICQAAGSLFKLLKADWKLREAEGGNYVIGFVILALLCSWTWQSTCFNLINGFVSEDIYFISLETYIFVKKTYIYKNRMYCITIFDSTEVWNLNASTVLLLIKYTYYTPALPILEHICIQRCAKAQIGKVFKFTREIFTNILLWKK